MAVVFLATLDSYSYDTFRDNSTHFPKKGVININTENAWFDYDLNHRNNVQIISVCRVVAQIFVFALYPVRTMTGRFDWIIMMYKAASLINPIQRRVP